jgi:hypothetical protein
MTDAPVPEPPPPEPWRTREVTIPLSLFILFWISALLGALDFIFRLIGLVRQWW